MPLELCLYCQVWESLAGIHIGSNLSFLVLKNVISFSEKYQSSQIFITEFIKVFFQQEVKSESWIYLSMENSS